MFHLNSPNQNRRIIAVHSKPVLTVILCAMTCAHAYSQKDSPENVQPATVHSRRPKILSKQEGLYIVAVARDSQPSRHDRTDCSHLVHAIYERAGFPYTYADSKDLYQGITSFFPVRHPQAGDLIVWRGHVGIVLSPRHHTFFSALSHGPGTDKYNARYWRRRGLPRFYRYIQAAPSRAALRPE
jgi:NlpC/P60 family